MKKIILSFIVVNLYSFAYSCEIVIHKNILQVKYPLISNKFIANRYSDFEFNSKIISTFSATKNIYYYSYYYKSAKEIHDSIYSIKPKDIGSFGFGLGLDYGGILGGNLLFYPQKNIGLFFGAGYALIGIGYNAGVKLRVPLGRFTPYFLCMYGYNTVIKISNAPMFNKFFYGYTIGLGEDFMSSKHNKNGHITFAILFPMRVYAVNDYIDDLKNNHNIVFKSSLIPFGISMGYRVLF